MSRPINKFNLLFIFLLILLSNFAFGYTIIHEPESPTLYLVNGNFSEDLDYNNFLNITDVTNGLKDNLSSTFYNLTIGDRCGETNLKWYYQFNDVGNNEIHDSSSNVDHNDLVLLPNADIVSEIDYYALELTSGSGSGANAPYTSSHDITTKDFVMSTVIKSNTVVATDQYIFSRYEFGGSGYSVGIGGTPNNGSAFCALDTDNSTAVRVDGFGTNVTDNQTHIITCIRDDTNLSIYIDGNYVNSIDSVSVSGDITSNAGLIFGGIYLVGIQGYNGLVDESYVGEGICQPEILDYIWTNKIKYNKSQSKSIMTFFNTSIDTNESYSMFVDVSVVEGDNIPFRIYSHINMTHINETNYKDQLLSDGINFISVDDLVYDGYNFPFRMTVLVSNGNSISETLLYEVGNDTSPPIISDCQTNLSFVGCNDSVQWKCKIEDDSAVSTAFGTVNIGGLFNVTREVFNLGGGYWGVNFDPTDTDILFTNLGWQFNTFVNVSLIYVNATDIAGNTAENFTNNFPSNTYGCLKCFEDWDVIDSVCLINDTKFRYYNDLNNCSNTPLNIDVPADNGTYVSCDYCVSDIQEDRSLCVYQNGTYIQNISYIDNLYSFCCAITGLDSDCGLDFTPFNETTTGFCTIFNNTMDCDSNTYTEFGFFGDKTRWICYPPPKNNDTTNCMSYVRDVHTGVIQTNPNYFTRTESLISLDNEIETRTSFEAVGNMVSVYFTKDNLVFDGREYVFGVRCTNNGDFYDYEQLITPEYENVNDPITRWFWVEKNILGIFLASIFTIVFVLVIAGYIRELRRK